jgi:hypothetical protein
VGQTQLAQVDPRDWAVILLWLMVRPINSNPLLLKQYSFYHDTRMRPIEQTKMNADFSLVESGLSVTAVSKL